MTDKQIDSCKFLSIYQTDCNGTLENTEMCHCYELYKQLARKEQECEMLKNQVLTTDDEAITVQVTQQQFEEYNKTKQALAEIKYIAEENIRIADLEGLSGVYRRGLAEQILQKISECEGNNEN